MKVFVVNCGSSSIKYKLFSMQNESVLAQGLLDRLGSGSPTLTHIVAEQTFKGAVDARDHKEGMHAILQALVDPKRGPLASIDEIEAVGHRVVHGGEKIPSPVSSTLRSRPPSAGCSR
jgi:acetate kinase